MLNGFETLNYLIYIPHGHCYLWQPQLVALHVVGDGFTALAYYSIPLILLYCIRARKDIPFKAVLVLFSCFILACGTTHLLEIWTLWQPDYWISGGMKLSTAAVSCYTAVVLTRIIPKALTLPSPAELEAANQALVDEIKERQGVEAELREYTQTLRNTLRYESTLKRITDKVRDSLDENYILNTVVSELGEVLQLECCDTGIYNLDAGTSTIAHEFTRSLPTAKGTSFTLQEATHQDIYQSLLAGQVVQFCDCLAYDVRQHVEKMAILACPITDDQSVLGDLWLFRHPADEFTLLEVRLIQQVTNQCAIALRQARLFDAAQAQVTELERLHRLKDDFLSTVSHELRTPISNMNMAIHMLQMIPSEDQRQRKYLTILDAECDREIDLINSLLDLQRLAASAYELYPEDVQIGTWLTQLTAGFQSRLNSYQQQFDLQCDTGEAVLWTDLGAIERVLSELLNNACKYTPPGCQIRCIARLLPTTTATDPLIEIQVKNEAEIPAAELPHIFDKFYRVPQGDPWKRGGTGLGLTLVQYLVEHLRGQISVTSQAGWTTFTVQLPHLRLDTVPKSADSLTSAPET